MENSRIDVLRRKNKGASRRKSLLQKLLDARLPSEFVCLLALEDSDAIRCRTEEEFASRDKMSSSILEKRIPFQAQIASSRLIPDFGSVFVIPWDAEFTGVFHWPATIVNSFWYRLVELEPDGLIVVDEVCKNKIVLQVLSDYGETELNIAVWGSVWKTHLEIL